MPRRCLKEPSFDVVAENGYVVMEAVVPHSRFGAVELMLTPEGATELAAQLTAATADVALDLSPSARQGGGE